MAVGPSIVTGFAKDFAAAALANPAQFLAVVARCHEHG